MSKEVINREEARKLGKLKFFTGIACKNGHVEERYTIGGKCLECNRNIAERWRSKHPDEHRERVYTIRDANPIAAKAITDKSYKKHRATRIASMKSYNDTNKVVLKIKADARNVANPSIRITNYANRRAREAGAIGMVTQKEINELFMCQNGSCFYCGEGLLEVYDREHFIPLAKGGTNKISNIVLSCQPCNHSKGKKLPTEWKPYIRMKAIKERVRRMSPDSWYQSLIERS